MFETAWPFQSIGQIEFGHAPPRRWHPPKPWWRDTFHPRTQSRPRRRLIGGGGKGVKVARTSRVHFSRLAAFMRSFRFFSLPLVFVFSRSPRGLEDENENENRGCLPRSKAFSIGCIQAGTKKYVVSVRMGESNIVRSYRSTRRFCSP